MKELFELKNSAIAMLKNSLQKVKTLIGNVNSLPKIFKSRKLKVGIISAFILMSFQSVVDSDNVDSNSKSKPLVLDSLGIKKKEKVFEVPVTYSDKLVNTIKKHEGIRLTAYNIGDGAYTIGYGHAVFKKTSRGDDGNKYPFLKSYSEYERMKRRGENLTISQSKAEELFRDDLKIASDALNRLISQWSDEGVKPKITQPMYDAMVSMIYNMGVRGFRLSDFIQLVKHSKFKEASAEIKNTSKRMFKKYPGLKKRRNTESEIFNGDYPM